MTNEATAKQARGSTEEGKREGKKAVRDSTRNMPATQAVVMVAVGMLVTLVAVVVVAVVVVAFLLALFALDELHA
jgi:cell division septal protein FtsQ